MFIDVHCHLDMLKDIERMLRNHQEIDTNRTLMVNLTDLLPSSLTFMVYTFTKTTKWVQYQAILQDVLLKILDIVYYHGAECAFPTQTLFMPDGIVLKEEPNLSNEN